MLVYIEPDDPGHMIGDAVCIQRRDLVRRARIRPDPDFRNEDLLFGEFTDLSESRTEYRIIGIVG